MNLKAEFIETYSGFPRWATGLAGWGTLAVFAVIGVYLARKPGRAEASGGKEVS